MATIEVDFDVYKALTAKRVTENDTYNDVIRSLLKLPTQPCIRVAPATKGARFKEVFFPDGTQFRATYKGRTYTAEIKNGAWRDSDGVSRNSPSEAAMKITGKNWNGWRFWHCKLPGDPAWSLIDNLRGRPSLADL